MRNKTHELIDDPKQASELAEAEGINVPEKIEGATGPKEIVPSEERRRRRQSMSNMLAAGRSDDDIILELGEQFGMTKDAVIRLRNEVFKRWAEEDSLRGKYRKLAAARRILEHISKAAEDGQYTAVASLERVLAPIEGTDSNDHGGDGGTVNVTNTLIAVLGDMSPEVLRDLIADGEKLFLDGRKVELPSGTDITIQSSKI